MFHCQFCSHVSSDIPGFLRHIKLHRNIANSLYKCGFPDCKCAFKQVRVLKSHVYRHHRQKEKGQSVCPDISLICHVDFCDVQCDGLSSFFRHLKTHITEGAMVTCPFRFCEKTFTVKSTFTSHLSRNHKSCTEGNLLGSITEAPFVNPGSSQQTNEKDQPSGVLSVSFPDDAEEIEVCPEIADETLFLQNLSLFYLKLQAKFLLPASVIQMIIEDIQDIHDVNQSHLLYKLNEKLVTLGLPEADVKQVIDVLKNEDLFRENNTNALKTDQRRKTLFKKSFNYVEPVPICLGQNESGKECFAQYVPIKDTLASLFHSESVRKQHAQVHGRVQNKDIIQDVWDGQTVSDNPLFKAETSSLGLILYQDAFEVVNPLGSGKRKHKVLGVYLSLADVLPHNRSRIDQMQLVLLCREQDFKYFGQELVFGRLVNDLKDLEINGVTMPDGEVRKGTLCAICGDNLGSHSIGGFVENFSRSVHFCRFCEIDRQTFQSEPLSKAPTRTPQSYNEHLQNKGNESNVQFGIKFDSLFNDLTYFHVAQPGLPPCLGHDLFEGVVSYDLALYLKHLVIQEKHFSYLELNRRINKFKYLGNDANDKPCEVNPGSEKLSGHAIQNWCFLRVLPLLVGDRIDCPAENEVWQLVLQLRQIVELICAPAITTGQIAYLRVLIEEYLHIRMLTFPDQPLKPKHHYIMHYPELIVCCGPLIRLWTLRFESKHTYFKQCARKLHNFKNLCLTLAERHQLLQAFLGAGSLFPPDVVVERGTVFYSVDYNDEIRESVAHFDFHSENTVMAHSVTVKGTCYKKNMVVAIERVDEGVVFGKIKMILIHQESAVHFITERCLSVRLPDQGVYCLESTKKYLCISQDKLLDYSPLPQYCMCDLPVVVLHHSFPSLE